jgi:hypothetical protein
MIKINYPFNMMKNKIYRNNISKKDAKHQKTKIMKRKTVI